MTDPLAKDLIEVPSGQEVTLQEVITNEAGPSGLTMRFRFIAPQIARSGGTVDFDTASEDMLHLCQVYALPRATGSVPAPEQIIISLSDVALPFGEVDPGATQFFEAFALEDGDCILEMF